jgi:hypothetical protein
MKKLFLSTIIMLAIAVLAACGAESASSSDEESDAELSHLVISSGPIGGGWYNTAAGMAEILMREIDGLNVTVNEGGGYENILLVNNGDAHIGYAFTNDVLSALEGTGTFEEDGQMENVSTFLSLYSSHLQTVTLANSDINSYGDFGDKDILPGEASFATVQHVETILNQYDISYDSIRDSGGSVSYTGYSDMTDLVKDGHADVAIGMTAAPSGFIMELNAQRDIKFIEIEPEVAKHIEQEIPGIFPMEMPANTYDGQTEPVNTLGSYTNLVMSKEVPEDLAYEITKVIIENRDELEEVDSILENFNEDTMTDGLEEDTLHPGVLKYKEEN